MARKEEIQKLIDEETGIDNYGSSDYQIGVCDGVRLADKTMLDCACSVFSDILIEIYPELLSYGAGTKAWENEFRKRLEGGME